MSDIVIGIDLGTTNSSVAYYVNGQVKILENKQGDRTTPSYVFYSKASDSIVGKYAKEMAAGKPEWGICEIKRLIGRKFDDPDLQKNLSYLPFEVDNHSGSPVIILRHENETLKKSPQELCAVILKKIKEDVESKLGHAVDKTVITVPAYFNVSQREDTLAAANQAGFTVLKLFNEPTAAALSYYFQNSCETDSYSLVYDLGGGTFDVSILKRNSTNIDIVCVDGDSHLGGQDLDNLIYDYVRNELISKYADDVNSSKRNMRRLRNKCEKAKKRLSEIEETEICLEVFLKDHDSINISLSRKQFEKMADELFKKTINIVERCLKSSNLPKTAVEKIILSGGSSRIPKIQEMLSIYFDGKDLNRFVNPDECVAEGAALQAAMLSNNPNQHIDHLRIIDVTPLSLGLAEVANLMNVVIKRNTPLPVTKSIAHGTVYNQQRIIRFRVYEGERSDVRKNRCLGTITISDITPAPPGQCVVTCTMNIDQNGILTVKAKERNSNNVKDLKILYSRGSRSASEIKNILLDEEDNKKEDERFEAFAKSKGYLLRYCESAMYNFKNKNLIESNSKIYELCKEVKISGKNMEVGDEDQLNEMIESVKEVCEPLVKKYSFKLMPIRT